ncbi:hypothetical protein PQX77_004718 [Marasmius sp. AFHP31]|nr:hypothetical protein PQX77_004718 [Marasmius sp. AFHP31]
MMLTPEQFAQEQKAGMPPVVEGVSLEDQVIILTGANTGIGYEAAKHFAHRKPHKLILVCRNELKGRDTLQTAWCLGLKTETGFQNVEAWAVDFSSFDSVKAVETKIAKLERLDILVENAGVAMYDYEVTKDGWETSLQVNVLSCAMHIILHLPKMLQTAKEHPGTVPRIVVVSSDTHYWGKISAEAMNAPSTLRSLSDHNPAQFTADKMYPETKSNEYLPLPPDRYSVYPVLSTMFIRTLQSHLPTITCCAVNPGFCHSGLTRHAPEAVAERFRKEKELLAYTPEEGSRQLIYAAIGQREREEELRASYVSFSRVSECSDFILGNEGRALERKLWEEVTKVVSGADENTRDIVGRYLS